MPAPLTRLIGRDAEIGALTAALRETRLLTLVGPGGSGKTRLARAVADRLTGPVRWVSLGQLDRPELLPAAVADAVDAPPAPGGSLIDAVTGLLGDGVLVLDNCEHLVADCAAYAGELLRACPGLRIMATSRERLAVAGETTWWVRGLTVPAERTATTAADLTGSQAVRLFADRARLVSPDFAVTDANAAHVAQLCRRLDGMPLALELAAARLRMLALPRLVAWLDDAVSLLVTTNRDVPVRQATMRATLDWSFDLLPAPERELFTRLSVFRGAFTLAAAAAVAGAGELDTLELLARLVDKSLVQARTGGDEERYRLLEVVRQYAARRLGDDDGVAATRHAGFMAELAERAEHDADRLHDERGNLRAALSWAGRYDPALLLRLGSALGRYWRLRGHYTEGRQWLTAAVEKSGDAAAAKALIVLGTLEFLQCDYGPATAHLERAREGYAAAGDDRGVATALHLLGSIAREQGRLAEAARHHDKVLAIAERGADPAGVARAYRSMGFTARLAGDHDRAVTLSADALYRYRRLGDQEGEAGALVDLAAATHRRGDPTAAEPLLRQGQAIADRLGFREVTAWAKEQLGLVVAAAGEPAEAVRLLRQGLAVHHELGDRWRTAAVLNELAGLHEDAYAGARLLAAADRLRETVGTPLPPSEIDDHERRSAAIRAALGPARWERATAEGRALAVDEAVALALVAHRPPVTGLLVEALGRGRVTLSGRLLGADDWTYAKPRELFYFLLARPGSTKAEIGVALWPDAAPAELRNAFHTCLKHLRRAIGPAAAVRYRHGAYAVEPAGDLHYDVAAFRSAAATGTVAGLTEAAAGYRGDYLGDAPAGGWADDERHQLRHEYEQVLRTLGGLLARERKWRQAADVFARLVAHDPLLETAHRALMRCHLALGDHGRALRQYHELARLLDEQLGARPAAETAQLYARIHAADAEPLIPRSA